MSQYKKDQIEIKILRSARSMFLKHGYLKTNLRAISKQAKISLSNLYNYYPNKDALFVAVLSPLLNDLEKVCEYGRSYPLKNDLFEKLEDKQNNITIAIDYIDKHRRELNLLFNLSSGSSLEKYADYLSQEYEKNWVLFFDNLSKQYPNEKFKQPSSFFLHNMASFHIMTVRNIISRKLSHNEMTKLAEELTIFFWYGGMGLMKDSI
jgi:AcrR family transcriptional regulator